MLQKHTISARIEALKKLQSSDGSFMRKTSIDGFISELESMTQMIANLRIDLQNEANLKIRADELMKASNLRNEILEKKLQNALQELEVNKMNANKISTRRPVGSVVSNIVHTTQDTRYDEINSYANTSNLKAHTFDLNDETTNSTQEKSYSEWLKARNHIYLPNNNSVSPTPSEDRKNNSLSTRIDLENKSISKTINSNMSYQHGNNSHRFRNDTQVSVDQIHVDDCDDNDEDEEEDSPPPPPSIPPPPLVHPFPYDSHTSVSYPHVAKANNDVTSETTVRGKASISPAPAPVPVPVATHTSTTVSHYLLPRATTLNPSLPYASLVSEQQQQQQYSSQTPLPLPVPAPSQAQVQVPSVGSSSHSSATPVSGFPMDTGVSLHRHKSSRSSSSSRTKHDFNKTHKPNDHIPPHTTINSKYNTGTITVPYNDIFFDDSSISFTTTRTKRLLDHDTNSNNNISNISLIHSVDSLSLPSSLETLPHSHSHKNTTSTNHLLLESLESKLFQNIEKRKNIENNIFHYSEKNDSTRADSIDYSSTNSSYENYPVTKSLQTNNSYYGDRHSGDSHLRTKYNEIGERSRANQTSFTSNSNLNNLGYQDNEILLKKNALNVTDIGHVALPPSSSPYHNISNRVHRSDFL